jgi:hypothetical protein
MGISAKEMSKRLQPLLNQSKLNQLEETEIKKNERVLLQYKKFDFLNADISGDGVTKLDYKNQEYQEYKFYKNPMAKGHVDLIDTGNFINSFFLQSPLNNKTLFGASDSKALDLIEKYGDEILGINNNRFKLFLTKYIKENFIKAIKKELGQ